MWRCGNACRRVCGSYCSRCDFGKEEEMMAGIAFVAFIIGAAGIAGGIETESGIIVSAVILFLGIIGMLLTLHKEKHGSLLLFVSVLSICAFPVQALEDADRSEKAESGEVFQILTTAYCQGDVTSTGVKTREGICAVRSEWVGKTALVWTCNEDGTQGEFLGFWECLDTGFGADSDGDGIGSIEEGRVIDMYFPTLDKAREWMGLTNGKVYVQLVDAEG